MRSRVNKFITGVMLGISVPFLAIAGLETVTYISDLVATNPTTSDPTHQGDDHLRRIKSALLTTFPNINAAVTATDEELNFVDGVTSSVQTQINHGGINVTGKTGTAKTLSTSAASGGADGDIWYRR